MTIARKESSIEKAFLRKLKKSGIKCKVRKMNGEGNRSWPDRMILLKGGPAVFIEFKRPGEEATELQADLHNELRELQYPVAVFDDAQEAFDWLSDINSSVRIRPQKGYNKDK